MTSNWTQQWAPQCNVKTHYSGFMVSLWMCFSVGDSTLPSYSGQKEMTCRSGYPRHLDGCFTVSVTVPWSFHCIRPLLFHICLILEDISLFRQVRLFYHTPFLSLLCPLLARGSRWLRRCGSDAKWRMVTCRYSEIRSNRVLGQCWDL